MIGLLFFAFMPFAYLLVRGYNLLIVVRFIHGLATAIYGPVAMAGVADIAGRNKGEMLSKAMSQFTRTAYHLAVLEHV